MTTNGTRVVKALKGRDARNGRFITIATARRRPSTTIVERVPQRVRRARRR